MSIENRITKLEQHTPRRKSLGEMTDNELKEIICHGAGITPVELTDEKLKEIARGKI